MPARTFPTQKKMKAAIFVEPGRIVLDEKPIPDPGPLDALIRVTTTICGTDIHILKGEYPVAKGLGVSQCFPIRVEEIAGNVLSLAQEDGEQRHRTLGNFLRRKRMLGINDPFGDHCGIHPPQTW